MLFLRRHQASQSITETHMQAVLHAAYCTLLYRHGHVHAIDQDGCEFHICLVEHLAALSTREFAAAASKALSYRL